MNHPYVKPGSEDKRSPCPALNASANHGYINRDGKNIKLLDLIQAVHNVYNVSKDLALFLAGVGVLLCGDVLELKVDLDKLARHNRIEHDYSLVHRDAGGHKFAPTKPSRTLVNELLKINNIEGEEPKEYLTEKDFIQHRLNLMGGKELDAVHKLVASGEICMIMDVLGKKETVMDKDGKPIKDGRGNVKKELRVNKDLVRTWMYEERLPDPDKWEKPREEISFSRLSTEQTQYKKKVEELLDQQKKGTLSTYIESSEKFVEELIKRIHGTTDDSTALPAVFHTTKSHRT